MSNDITPRALPTTRTPAPARRSRRTALRAAAAALLLPAIAVAGAPAAGAATDTDPSLPDYTRIRAVDGFSVGSGTSTLHCVGSSTTLSCQTRMNWKVRGKEGNTLVFNLKKRRATAMSADMDVRNMRFKRLTPGTKYEFEGYVVQYKSGTLNFSSPKYGVRGELNGKGFRFPIRT